MMPGERLVPLREVKAEAGHMLTGKKNRGPRAPTRAGPILRVEGLSKSFNIRKSGFKGAKSDSALLAVDDVSFHIARGECLGLVGESGCGKTTASKLLLRAIVPDAGRVTFNDRGRIIDVLALSNKALKLFRRKIQFIFQDPFGSLNPRMTVFDIISEPLVIHAIGTTATRAEMVMELMRLVGLDPRFLNRYPTRSPAASASAWHRPRASAQARPVDLR